MCVSIVAANQSLNYTPAQRKCSAKFLNSRPFQQLTFAEIADLSDQCDLWELDTTARKMPKPPVTFTVPTAQLFASISRIIE
jgi:hypothetical protein